MENKKAQEKPKELKRILGNPRKGQESLEQTQERPRDGQESPEEAQERFM